jgi:hypothetical protein
MSQQLRHPRDLVSVRGPVEVDHAGKTAHISKPSLPAERSGYESDRRKPGPQPAADIRAVSAKPCVS